MAYEKQKQKKKNLNQKKLNFRKINWVFIFLIVIFLIIWFLFQPLDVKKLDIRFEVGERLGVVLDGENLDFGRVLAGSSSVKTVSIENNFDFLIKVEVFVDRRLKDFIFAEPEISIDSGEVINLPINLILPDDIEKGNYSGGLRFEFRKER
tara:strand:+ start:1657 stop:2109 length:453 start_codon:yes stop_codon:yes gene_type:complete